MPIVLLLQGHRKAIHPEAPWYNPKAVVNSEDESDADENESVDVPQATVVGHVVELHYLNKDDDEVTFHD